jgi:hypothetical protein
VPFAERNHQVQALASDRADHAFVEGIRLWSTHRCLQDRQPHRVKRAINACRIDRVAIVDHEAMRLIALNDHPKLLRRPVRGRMRRHVPMQNPPRTTSRTTYTMRNVAVTTTKKSLARTSRAWFRTNVLQACVPDLGRRGRNGMYRRTVRGDNRMPSFSRSSLAIRSSPHVRLAAARPVKPQAGRAYVTSNARTVGIPVDASGSVSPASR